MIVGAFLVARAGGLSFRDIGFVWRKPGLQVAVVLVSIVLGFAEYAILQPAPMGPEAWMAGGVAPALIVGVATGLPEELIFRGLLQTATRPILGGWNWIYASAVFAALHIGHQSAVDVVFVFGVGLLFGWVFERSRSIIGIVIAHGAANIMLFFVAPNLPLMVDWFGA
jgi:membrane protease YdiL (CAAX protease family)